VVSCIYNVSKMSKLFAKYPLVDEIVFNDEDGELALEGGMIWSRRCNTSEYRWRWTWLGQEPHTTVVW
jgi:hypothetical protein